MKLLVMSDTHKDIMAMEEVIRLYTEKVDAIIHCGDSELEASFLRTNLFPLLKGIVIMILDFQRKKLFRWKTKPF